LLFWLVIPAKAEIIIPPKIKGSIPSGLSSKNIARPATNMKYIGKRDKPKGQ
jgi:hypothetical protein